MVSDEKEKIWKLPTDIILEHLRIIVLSYLPDTSISLKDWEFVNFSFEVLEERERKFQSEDN